jgi:valyl-tRNA synthetase
MPFITEEIWQNLPGNDGSIMVSEFPRIQENEIHLREEAQMELIMKVIGAIRNLRSELEIAPGKKVEAILYCPKKETLHFLQENRPYLENLGRTEKLGLQAGGQRPKASATAIVDEVEVFLPLRGLINLDEEEKRVQKDLARVYDELSRTRRKLQNQDFLSRARPEAVEKEKEKARALAEKEAKLKESLERVKGWRKET